MTDEIHLWAVACSFSGPRRCKFYKTILHWQGKLECLYLVSCISHQMYMDMHWASFRRLLNYHPALDHLQYANLQQSVHFKIYIVICSKKKRVLQYWLQELSDMLNFLVQKLHRKPKNTTKINKLLITDHQSLTT